MVEAKSKYDVEQQSQQVGEKGRKAEADLGGQWHPFQARFGIQGLPAAGRFYRTLLDSLLAVCAAYSANLVSLAVCVTPQHLSFPISEVGMLIISLFCLSQWVVKRIKSDKKDEILKHQESGMAARIFVDEDISQIPSSNQHELFCNRKCHTGRERF